MIRRRRVVLFVGIVLFVSIVASLASIALVAQKKDDRSEAQKKEIQAVVKLADDVVAGATAPNDLGLVWAHEDYMKAAGNKAYVPFTVTLDASKATGQTLTLYWRVVPKAGAAGVAPAAIRKDDKNPVAKEAPVKRDFPYEDVSTVTLTSKTTQRISRSFIIPAGAYDVLVVAKEPASTVKGAPAPKASVAKQTVAAPDFWNGELNTSSVIMAQRIEPLPAPLTAQQQADRPYALGQMEITPLLDLKFSKKDEISSFLLIYNPKPAPDNKPDVTVEYNFYAKSGGTEKFFNKTPTLSLNGQTLDAKFDLMLDHQLQAGQAVQLTTFPEGDYRLEIKVTDRIAKKSVTQNVLFSVGAS